MVGRLLPAKAALPTGKIRIDRHSLAPLKPGDAFPHLYDLAPKLVARDEGKGAGIFPTIDVQVRATDADLGNPHNDLILATGWIGYLFHTDLIGGRKDHSLHEQLLTGGAKEDLLQTAHVYSDNSDPISR
jgi:hypothetical protein